MLINLILTSINCHNTTSATRVTASQLMTCKKVITAGDSATVCQAEVYAIIRAEKALRGKRGTHNGVALHWVQVRAGCALNEVADKLAKKEGGGGWGSPIRDNLNSPCSLQKGHTRSMPR